MQIQMSESKRNIFALVIVMITIVATEEYKRYTEIIYSPDFW